MVLLIAVGGGVSAQPVLPAVVADPAPVIDGDLSDACWQTAPSVTDFYFLPDGSRAPEATTAWLCYDQENIYIAFDCKDSQPDKIVAQQKKRGGDIGRDDWVGIELDCHCNYYSGQLNWFKVTAGGVQCEKLHSGEASNIQWKGDWDAATERVDDGYTVEIAVPFSILQYDATRTSMGIALARSHARINQDWWSPNLGASHELRRFYLWDGLKLPRPNAKPLILGYSLFGTGEDNSSERLGLDIKHAITRGLNGLVTINPDFRSIEQEVDTVDFSYTERWLPDSRPFFLEGPGYFPSWNIFYTRRIREIDIGAKLSGKTGLYDLAFMHTSRFGDEHHDLLQIGRHWEDHTSLWLCGMESQVPGINNTVTQTSLRHRLRKVGDREVWFSSAYATADAASGSGEGKWFYARMYNRGRPRELHWFVEHRIIDSDFDPYLGLVGDKGITKWYASFDLFDKRSEGRLHSWYSGVGISRAERLDGSLFYNSVDVYGDIYFRNGKGISVGAWASHRPPNHDGTFGTSFYWGGRDLYRNGGFGVAAGKQAGGDYLYWRVSQGWQMTDRLSIRGSYEYAHIKEPSPDAYCSGQLIASMVYDLDNERTLGGRLVSRKGKTNLYLAFKQRVRAGLDAYVILGDPNAESTRSSLTLKLVRPL